MQVLTNYKHGEMLSMCGSELPLNRVGISGQIETILLELQVKDLMQIAIGALLYQKERNFCDLYYQLGYGLKQVSENTGLSITEAEQRRDCVIQKISNAVRAMCREDPRLDTIAIGILEDNRRFQQYFTLALSSINPHPLDKNSPDFERRIA